MALPYWIEYIFLNPQAERSFNEWIEGCERQFAAEMQRQLLEGDTQKATHAALKLSIYQDIAKKFKTEADEKRQTAEYLEKTQGGK